MDRLFRNEVEGVMTKKGCNSCREKKEDPAFYHIQTACFVIDQNIPFGMFLGVWRGAMRGMSPSWRLLGGL